MDQFYIDDGYFDTTGYFAYIAEASSEPYSLFTLDATGDVAGGVSATLSAVANTSIVDTRRRLGTAQFDAVTSKVTAAGKTSAVSADCLSSFTMTASGSRIAKGNSQLSTQATLSAIFSTLVYADAALSTAFTVSASGARRFDNSASLSTAASLTVAYAVKKLAQSALSSTATLEAAAFKQFNPNIALTTTSSLAVSTSIKRGTVVDLFNQAGTIINASKVVAPNAFLVASGGILSVGSIINLDPYLTYRVKQETRQYLMQEETRLHSIKQETRTIIL